MINRKCNCKNKISSQKLAVLKKSISCKDVRLAIYNVTLWAIIDTQERTPALKLHLNWYWVYSITNE